MHTGFGGENVGMKLFGCSRLRRGDKMERNLKRNRVTWRGFDSSGSGNGEVDGCYGQVV